MHRWEGPWCDGCQCPGQGPGQGVWVCHCHHHRSAVYHTTHNDCSLQVAPVRPGGSEAHCLTITLSDTSWFPPSISPTSCPKLRMWMSRLCVHMEGLFCELSLSPTPPSTTRLQLPLSPTYYHKYLILKHLFPPPFNSPSFVPLPPRSDRTKVEGNTVVVYVKKFGAPTLQEEQEGRVIHEVTIVARKTTRFVEETPVIDRFRYTCTCTRYRVTKKFCIHWGVVMLSHFV